VEELLKRSSYEAADAMPKNLVETTERFKKNWIVDTFTKKQNTLSLITIDQYSVCKCLFEVEHLGNYYYYLHFMS
jgi:hypothetical protein